MDVERQYLNYNEYKSLGGDLDQTPFNLLEFKARKQIDRYTLNRVKNESQIIEEIKKCMFELITLFVSINNGVEISGNAINYSDKEINAQIFSIISSNLFGCKTSDNEHYIYIGV